YGSRPCGPRKIAMQTTGRIDASRPLASPSFPSAESTISRRLFLLFSLRGDSMSGPMIYPIFVILIALQHIGFTLLETYFWDKPLGRKIFRTTPEFAAQSRMLAANQGLYNLFLAAGLLLSFYLDASSAHSFRFFFLG